MPRVSIRSYLGLLLIAAVLLIPLASMAQESATPRSAIADEQQAVIEELASRTNELEKKIHANSDDDFRLGDIRLQLEEVSRQLIAASVSFRPRLAEINARIDRLGPPPAAGAPPEADIVTSERQALAAEKAEINATLGVAEDLSIRVSTLTARVTEMRRDLFSRLLTRRYAVSLDLAGEVAGAFAETSQALHRAVAGWLRFVVKFKLSSVLGATAMALVAAIVLLVGSRRAFGHLFEADPNRKGSQLSKQAFRGLLVDLGAVHHAGRVSWRELLFLRLFRGAARRHRPYAGRALRRDRPGLLRAPAGQGGSVAALAGVAADTRPLRRGFEAALDHVGDGVLQRRRFPALDHLRNARRAAVAHRGRGIGRHGGDRRPHRPQRFSQAVRRPRRSPRVAAGGSLFPLRSRPRHDCRGAARLCRAGPVHFPAGRVDRRRAGHHVYRVPVVARCLGGRRLRAHRHGRTLPALVQAGRFGAGPGQPRGQHPHQRRRRGDRAAADPVPVGLPAGRHQRLGLQVGDRHPDRVLHAVADGDPVRSSRLRRRLHDYALVPGLAGRICDGARPRR